MGKNAKKEISNCLISPFMNQRVAHKRIMYVLVMEKVKKTTNFLGQRKLVALIIDIIYL